MQVVLIEDKQIKLEILRIIVFLYTAVPRGIAVFFLDKKDKFSVFVFYQFVH